MSLANIQGKLSRKEMKNIMAGSGGACLSRSCTLYANGQTYSGSCGIRGYNGSGGSTNPTWASCLCQTSYGPYFPSSGTSHCVV
jgi:hypothetical protein